MRDDYQVHDNQPYTGASSRKSGRVAWKKLLLVPVILFVIFLLGLLFIARPYVVHGISMEPTVHPGDRVLVLKYQFGRTPDRGDIVVLRDDAGDGEMLIKRVIAIAGDIVSIGKDRITVNGEKTYPNTLRPGQEERELQVPHRYIFLRGDNESVSYDSRNFGPVPVDRVKGRAIFIFWPPNHMDSL